MPDWLTSPWALKVGPPLVIVAVLGLTKWGRDRVKSIWRKLSRRSPPFPRRTLALRPEVDGLWWSEGTMKGKPAMMVVARLHVANLSDERVKVVKAWITRPYTEGLMVIVRHPTRNEYGGFVVLPRQKSQLHCDFWIEPPIRKPGQSLKATIVVVDQYGNEHRLRRLTFRGLVPRPQASEAAAPPAQT